MTSDTLRMAWTAVGFVGVIAGFIGLGIMRWLILEARKYDWAIQQVSRPGLAMLRMHTKGELWDSIAIAVGVILLFLTVVSMTGAGVAAMFANGPVALVLLVCAELFAVACLIALVIFGVKKMHRQRAVFNAARLSKEAH